MTVAATAQPAAAGFSVPDALLAMATAVRSGEMMQAGALDFATRPGLTQNVSHRLDGNDAPALQAKAIGEQCKVPLSLTAAELAMSGAARARSTQVRGGWFHADAHDWPPGRLPRLAPCRRSAARMCAPYRTHRHWAVRDLR